MLIMSFGAIGVGLWPLKLWQPASTIGQKSIAIPLIGSNS
jgi:hypothetical protein